MPRIVMPVFEQVCWIYKLIRLETSLSIQIVVCLNCFCFPSLIICFLDVTDEIYWDRIAYFLKRIVPVAEEAKVKIACHPQDPAMPPETGWRGVNTVLGTPAGLKRFVETMPILAMPFIAPWGSLVGGVDRTRLVKPKYVVPVHDGFLSESGKDFMYGLATMGFADDDIELIHIPDFESVTLSTSR